MKICSIEGCGKKHWARGYCASHYRAFMTYGDPLVKKRPFYQRVHPEFCIEPGCTRKYRLHGYCMSHYFHHLIDGSLPIPRKLCSVEGCKSMVFCKGFCHAHYELFRRRGTPEKRSHPCKAPGCKRKVYYEYCHKHQQQIDKGIPLDAPLGWAVKGEKNVNWNGGVSQYPDHYTFKKQRLIKLAEVNYRCEECGGLARTVHHKDGTKTNHSIDNLKALCYKCHSREHRGTKRQTKFTRIYGMNTMELGKLLDVSPTTVFIWHRDGKLQSKLQEANYETV